MRNSYMKWLRRNDARDADPVPADMSWRDDHHRLRGTDRIPNWDEIWLLYPMLKFSHADKTHPDGGREADQDVYHYSCNHFDDVAKVCGIYDIRPSMCASFGSVGKAGCGYKACTWTESRTRRLEEDAKRAALDKERDEARMKPLAGMGICEAADTPCEAGG